MSEKIYLISMAAVLGTPLLIFAMKYWTAAREAAARLSEESVYRKLASDAITAQTGNAATLSAIQSELSEIKTRVEAVEKILKAVE